MDADRPEDHHDVRGHYERGARMPDDRADQSRGHEAQDDEVHEDRGPKQLAERQFQRSETRDPLKIKRVHLLLALDRQQGQEAAPEHEHERLRRHGDAQELEPPGAPETSVTRSGRSWARMLRISSGLAGMALT